MRSRSLPKTIALWTLIAALANPALTVPWAYARDTDIFLAIPPSTSTAEPNILVILDTSDSMNIFEGWREYSNTYDSHVEYLWNDPTYINTITVTAPNSNFTDIGSSPNGYFVSYSGACPDPNNGQCPRDSGFFAGSTDADRTAMRTAALNHANGTQAGDPGARSIYRNYNDASWVYWLPTGTAETDLRLWSVSFNRFVGGIRVSNFSSTNGSTNPVVRGGINYGNNRDFTMGSAFRNSAGQLNRCTASMSTLMPSTAYAPTEYGRNNGKLVNEQWMRWDRWLQLDNSRAAAYPGDHNTVTYSSGTYRIGMVGTGYDQAVTPFPGPTDPIVNQASSTPHGISVVPPNITASRDSVGTNGSQGQPIRVQKDTGASGFSDNPTVDSFAGWTNLKADHGGYTHQALVNAYAQATLQQLRGVYGYAALTVTGASATDNERFSAWKGNRDGAPAFGMETGTPAYYNIRPTSGGQDVIFNTAGSTTQTCTRTCTLAVGASGPTGDGLDGSNTTRQYFTPNGGGNYCAQSGALTGTNCYDAVTNPGGINPAACSSANTTNYVDRNHTGCAWTGRSSTYVEGIGTVYYGGTCSGSCRGAGFVLGAANCAAGATSTTYCNQASAANDGANWIGNLTISGTGYTNVTKNVIGTCSDIADTTQSCLARKGFNCVYGPSTVASFCPNRSSSVTTGGTTTRYPSYNRQANETNLVHDCKADEAANNGGTNVFMTALRRNFDQSFNTTISTSGTTAAYTTSSGDATSPPAIDLYSVNYLNFKFGPRGPNGLPIGRKTRLQIAKDALSDLIAITDGVRFGLETFNSLPNDITLRDTQGSQGGKIVFPIKRMGSSAADTDYPNRAALISVINSQLAKAATPLSESLYEAYLYFNGRAPRFGTSTAITTNFGAAALPAVGGGNVTDGADATAVSGANYVSPIMSNPTTADPAACQKNFVILLTDGGPEKDVDASAQIAALQYTQASGTIIAADTRIDSTQPDTSSGQFETGTPSLPFGPPSIADTARADGGYIWLDELAYFMRSADMSPGARHAPAEATSDQLVGTQTVTTYTIGFAGANSPVLENAASKGGGAFYLAEDASELSAVLTELISKIRDFSPTVAAPTVPLSALNRAQNALDVYLAFFAPVTSQSWKGTVKRYRLSDQAADCGTDQVLCLIGKTVLSSGLKNIERQESDGAGLTLTVVDPDAVSFWNPTTLKDGSKPDSGGTGYQLISQGVSYTPASRNVYTYITSGATSTTLTNSTNLWNEDNTRVTKTLLGNAAMSDAQRSTLINFARGGNPGDTACSDSTSATACTSWRTWPHGDVQHSRPVLVAYNTTPTADTEVGGSATRATSHYLFFLSNTGVLHAVDASTGQEAWAFVIQEAFSQLNAAMINASGVSLDLADGAPSVWVDRGDSNGIVDGSERVWIFFGLRRGGRVYYALDITSVTAPKFMWKISPTERCTGTSCTASTDFAQLGQTWSAPFVGRVAATTGASGARPNGNTDPVIMFGGGYDPQQDTYPLPVGTTQDTMGKALFVVEGSTGALVKSFTNVAADFLNAASGIEWSIPSDLTVLNTDGDGQGFLDRIVVGDVGGNLWRFDISNADATAWKGKKLASLSDTGVPNRKIFFAPSVVPQLAPFPIEWDAIYVGTGDREHPLVTPTSDKIFMVADFDIGLNATAGAAASFVGGDFLQLTESSTSGVVPASLVTKRGWYRDLQPGEKVTGPTFVINQKLRFGTYNPTAQSSDCLPPGEGRLNEINALYGNLVDLNGDGVIGSRDRYYANLSRGYFSPLQAVIVGRYLYTIGQAGAGGFKDPTVTTPGGPGTTGGPCTGALMLACREQQIGVAQRVYWYMEAER
jgi:type IV pilus assembly protein PilY1